MKKILFGILTFLGIGLSFCNANYDFGPFEYVYQGYNFAISTTPDPFYCLSTVQSRLWIMTDKVSSAYCTYVLSNFDLSSYITEGSLPNNIYDYGTYEVSCTEQAGSYYNGCSLNHDYDVYSITNIFPGTSLTLARNTSGVLDNSSLNFNCFRVSTTICRDPGNIVLYPPGSSVSQVLDFGSYNNTNTLVCGLGSGWKILNRSNSNCIFYFYNIPLGSSTPNCPDSLIDVQYNNGNTTTINCDGINYITIDGLSSLESSNVNYKYSPYFNVSYKDEDNQSLIESYDKSILYLENGQFKKTYTGNNDWILTVQGGNNSNFNGYLPTFDVVFTGDSLDTGNIFNNFAENSLKFTLSNIPSYIQYVIIIMLLFLILGFIRKFKRK